MAAQLCDIPDRGCNAKPPRTGKSCNSALHDASVMLANPTLGDVYSRLIGGIGFVFVHDFSPPFILELPQIKFHSRKQISAIRSM